MLVRPVWLLIICPNTKILHLGSYYLVPSTGTIARNKVLQLVCRPMVCWACACGVTSKRTMPYWGDASRATVLDHQTPRFTQPR